MNLPCSVSVAMSDSYGKAKYVRMEFSQEELEGMSSAEFIERLVTPITHMLLGKMGYGDDKKESER